MVEGAPAWDDETFPSSWATFTTGTLQHLVRVIERLHGRPVDPDELEPATRAWLVGVAAAAAASTTSRPPSGCGRSPAGSRADGPRRGPPHADADPAPGADRRIQSQAGVTDDAGRFSALVRIWNVTGQPAISLPLAQTDAGVPVGVAAGRPRTAATTCS